MTEFLYSAQGQISRHRWRRRQRFVAMIRGIEPRAKSSMPPADKLALQRAVVNAMIAQGRRPFRGTLALDVSFRTTARDPSHIPQLAKNVVDLLARPLPGLGSRRRAILYYDDRQIDALSVTCRHQAPQTDREAEDKSDQPEPRIAIKAIRHSLFMEEIAAGAEAEDFFGNMGEDFEPESEFADGLDAEGDPAELDDADREHEMKHWRDPVFLELAEQEAQQHVLELSRVSIPLLALVHGAYPFPFGYPRGERDQLRESMNDTLVRAPTRIWLDELPTRPGTSDLFRELVRQRVHDFWERWEGLFGHRLRVPIALEVLVKPPLEASANALHDLDNVVQNYLVRPIVDRLQPPTHVALSYDPEQFRHHNGALPPWLESVRSIPRSTWVGLTRYEAWRLRRPVDDKEPGFVSVGLAPDPVGPMSLMDRIDALMYRWEEWLR